MTGTTRRGGKFSIGRSPPSNESWHTPIPCCWRGATSNSTLRCSRSGRCLSLCERHPIALLPSFNLARFWEPQKASRPRAVFADSLEDLLYARKEADSVANALNCQQLRGKQITRGSFLSIMSSCDLLHAACHTRHHLFFGARRS
jgi:CHAT domain-containing protein